MAISMRVQVKDEAVLRALNKVEDRADHLKPVFLRFAQYMRVETSKTFDALRTGGSYRGVRWRYFAPQYTRKTDGVTVPAWGGVPKLRGRGNVLGRKRPSGQRVAKGDAIMQDTGTMRSRAALVIHLKKHSGTLGPQGVNYAAQQQAMRPFLFFAKADGNQFAQMLRVYLTGAQ